MEGNVINRIMERENGSFEPFLGMGVTQCCWSDRYPYYVVGWFRNKKGEVTELNIQPADCECKDYYAGDWEVKPFEGYVEGRQMITIKRTRPNKKGQRFWTYDGTMNSAKFAIGRCERYEDPSF